MFVEGMRRVGHYLEHRATLATLAGSFIHSGSEWKIALHSDMGNGAELASGVPMRPCCLSIRSL